MVWHKTEPRKVKGENTQKKTVQPKSKNSSPKEMVAIDVKWLKDNIDGLMTNAINQPTRENLAAYAYAQRLMLDMGSRFFFKNDSIYGIRRSTG